MATGTAKWDTVPKLLDGVRVRDYRPRTLEAEGIENLFFSNLLNTSHDLLNRLGCHSVPLFPHLPRSCHVRPLHASLTPDQRPDLLDLRRDPDLRPRVRLRVECLLLSAGGMKVPQLAAHLDCCEATVRTLLHRFVEEDLDAVYPQPPGFPPDLAHRQRIEEALDRLLHRQRTWTVITLSEALAAEEDIHLKPRTVRFYLKRMGAQWRRTLACVCHKQDPALAAAAGTTLAGLKKVPGHGAGPLLPRRDRLQLLPAPPPTPRPRRACDRSSPTKTPRAGA